MTNYYTDIYEEYYPEVGSFCIRVTIKETGVICSGSGNIECCEVMSGIEILKVDTGVPCP